ncbi:MAG: SURF1 family protein [Rhodocyclales bacterium]|nr:SURF1 family protein [Rhodocyclales bacterium]
MLGLIPGRRRFAEGLVPGLAALLAIALFTELGFWQLQRAADARARQATTAERRQLPPVDLDRMGAEPVDSLLWRSATVSGKWQARPVVLLDNQTVAGRVGYLVFGVLHPAGCTCALLVDRGWIAAGPDRASIPDLPPPPDAATLRGRLTPLPPAGVGARNDVEFLPGGRMRIQRLDLASIPLDPGMRLLPVVLRLDPAATDVLIRDRTQTMSKADRHQAYAVQWFIFALLAAGLYGLLNLKPG